MPEALFLNQATMQIIGIMCSLAEEVIPIARSNALCFRSRFDSMTLPYPAICLSPEFAT